MLERAETDHSATATLKTSSPPSARFWARLHVFQGFDLTSLLDHGLQLLWHLLRRLGLHLRNDPFHRVGRDKNTSEDDQEQHERKQGEEAPVGQRRGVGGHAVFEVAGCHPFDDLDDACYPHTFT